MYAPGTRLQEGTLAAELDVSKTPVREAMGRLVHEHLLEVYPRLGYTVTAISPEDALALMEYRDVLEGAAAELAARYITDSELIQLESLLDIDYQSADRATYASFLSQNRRFHLLVARASRNSYLADALDKVFDDVDRLLTHRLDAAVPVDEVTSEHRLVVNALRSGDPGSARVAMLQGLHNTRQAALESLKAVPRPGAGARSSDGARHLATLTPAVSELG